MDAAGATPPSAPADTSGADGGGDASHCDDYDYSDATTASDIIRLLDRAVADARTSAFIALGEIDEARRNARAASEVVKRFLPRHSGLSIKGVGSVSPSSGSQLMLNGNNSTTAKSLLSSPRLSLSASASSSSTPRRAVPISPRSPSFAVNGGTTSPRHFTPLFLSGSSSLKRKNGSSSPASTTWNATAPSGNTFFSPTSSEAAIAAESLVHRQRAEELVALTIELDRATQALEAEQLRHDETKAALQRAKSKATDLESQMGQLLSDVETHRDASGRQADVLEQELAHARMRVEAAEEDANLALEIAKENDERREQVEAQLATANARVEELEAQVASLSRARANPPRPPPPPPPPPPPLPPSPSTHDNGGAAQHGETVSHQPGAPTSLPKVVRFAEDSLPPPSPLGEESPRDHPRPPSTARPDRLLVASGRALLKHRSVGGSSSASALDEVDFDAIEERRKRLRERVKQLEEQAASPTFSTASLSSATSFASPSPRKDNNDPGRPPLSNTPLDVATRDAAIRATARLLQISGRRLGLTGRWWNDAAAPLGGEAESTAASPSGTNKESPAASAASSFASSSPLIPLETLMRHYCTSVEVRCWFQPDSSRRCPARCHLLTLTIFDWGRSWWTRRIGKSWS